MTLGARVNELRTARFHLNAQLDADLDTQYGSVDDAREALARVDADLAEAEAEAREKPELAYLFGRSKRGSRGRRARVQSELPPLTTTKEEPMARKSNAQALEDVLVALKKAEKAMGNTKWALSGKGAEKNPPSPERKKALKAKLDAETSTVAELRAKRDELKAKA